MQIFNNLCSSAIRVHKMVNIYSLHFFSAPLDLCKICVYFQIGIKKNLFGLSTANHLLLTRNYFRSNFLLNFINLSQKCNVFDHFLYLFFLFSFNSHLIIYHAHWLVKAIETIKKEKKTIRMQTSDETL